MDKQKEWKAGKGCLSHKLQLVISNVFTKAQNPSCSWEIFVKTLIRKKKMDKETDKQDEANCTTKQPHRKK